MTQTVVGLYDDVDTAHKVVRELRDAGVSNDSISLVAQDASGEYSNYVGKDMSKMKKTDSTGDGAAAGAGIGAVVGGIGGLLVGLGALTIPGIGPVLAAGPLATAVSALVGAGAGALAGGVAGGLIGALVDLGVPEEEAGYYAEGVRRGGTLVTVTAADNEVDRVTNLMNRYHPVDLNRRVESWRQAGWKGYDASAKPYSAQQSVTERQQWQNTGGTSRPTTGTVRGYPYSGMRSTSAGDMDRMRTHWRSHYQTNLATTGQPYDYYEPAYQYGYDLHQNASYRNYDWERLEPEARRSWEQRYPNTAWDRVKMAVRRGWEEMKDAVGA